VAVRDKIDFYYAYEVFPWADIAKSVTIDGLFSQRTTHLRREWGRVLAGTDEQLVESLISLDRVSAANNAVSDDAVLMFYRHMVRSGTFEKVAVSPLYPSDQEVSNFFAGWRAALHAHRVEKTNPS
jgi:hypothetical protein